ncbi:MAG: hypothetical protein HYX24_05095 [Candidatus Aenigmarchaeota archaeon]|nr:hypothetical protein [Candidatus Aenigmarchaeota archaeon]
MTIRTDFMDAFHLACSRQKHVKTFVTIDSRLVHNEVLETLLEIRIMHPKELI